MFFYFLSFQCLKSIKKCSQIVAQSTGTKPHEAGVINNLNDKY
jgi:hypothetical protein